MEFLMLCKWQELNGMVVGEDIDKNIYVSLLRYVLYIFLVKED